MIHFASSSFWSAYELIPTEIQKIADRNYKILKQNPRHPSLYFKKINKYRSVRVGIHYRALSIEVKNGLLWFWIGSHTEYDKLIKS